MILKATRLLIAYIDDNGPIGLTASKALKRYFMEWAAEAFEWPGYTAEELYEINRVLNEHDFPPLMVLHQVLLSAKLVRHFKGALRLTKLANALKGRPGELWQLVTAHLLFAVDYRDWARSEEGLMGNWDIFLNVINVEAQPVVARSKLISVLYGGDDQRDSIVASRLSSSLHVQVLRPLCWAGLLQEAEPGTLLRSDAVFAKTPLWTATMRLETDDYPLPFPANDDDTSGPSAPN